MIDLIQFEKGKKIYVVDDDTKAVNKQVIICKASDLIDFIY